jgi:peptide/nickel transport system substrate-binding protein
MMSTSTKRPPAPRAWRSTVLTHVIALALASAATLAAAQEKPQYGGTLITPTLSPTISVLTWDPADFNWKINMDTGLVYEQLFAGDLTKAKRFGGPYVFHADAWLPSDAIRGELAESWKWTDDKHLEIKLRKGIMYPEKPGVMKARELVADDVVFTFNRQNKSPKKIDKYFDFLDKVEAKDSHTVVLTFNQYNAEWDYRFGWGYYSPIMPKEVADADPTKWQNINGTGPFTLTDFVRDSSTVYSRNPNYWDSISIGGKSYKLPFLDKIVYRPMRDEATQLAALRTGKIDMLENIRWDAVEELKKSAPQLQWDRFLAYSSTYLAMRVDTKPFTDIRVRRALNMAINKQEIIDRYYGGNAMMMAFPQHPDFVGYFEPLESMPDSVKELFVYNPDKAKKLLAEAGYPNGFTFKVQVCACNQSHMELLPLLAAYLEKVGVKIEIQPMEYAGFLSAMTTRTVAPGYLMSNAHTNPTTTLRKNFVPRQVWNPAQYDDPEFTRRVNAMYEERDESKRQKIARELTREILDKAPYIWLPTGYTYAAWWPWVKNYGDERYAGAARPGPIYARIWIDQALKKKLGF